MTTSSTAMLVESAAYRRMRAESPAEFVPRSVFFAHDKEGRVDIDRANSFWVKAALVYESVTGLHVNDETKPDAHRLLLSLAKECCRRIHADPSPRPPPTTPSSPPSDPGAQAGTGPSISVEQGGKRAQLPDEGSDKNKQVIDGIFLVVGFLSRLRNLASNSRDAVDESFKSTHMQDIVTDVIKLENQLPLKQLLDVIDHVDEAVNVILGSDDFKFKGRLENTKYELGFKRDTFDKVISTFCWYYSPFFSKKAAAPPKDDSQSKSAAVNPSMEARTLLDCLHDSLVPPAPVGSGAGGGGGGGGKTSRMPTARQLSRSGVRFEAGEDGRAVVEFKEPKLRLPALVYDFKLATVARNLLAREYEEQSKPVTRYFQMMNELVEEVADVRVLRRAGVVRFGSSGPHEVHELVKRIDGYATYPSVFMAMDLQIEKVNQFHNKRMKNFLVRYRPGVIWASSVAAVSVVAIVAARKRRA